jgi:hypothetical protein
VSHAQRMIEANSTFAPVDAAALLECFEACLDCTQVRTACVDACLVEQVLRMNAGSLNPPRPRLCADVCDATGKILSREAFEPQIAATVLWACAKAYRFCAEECERYAWHDL